ncbi:Sedlin [Hyphopichia burtonii NRRL Y-1933]|uniref:Sedlin n=1 Tax=Hyphopichia burtonii NRRL Y-1933 TaxID=984485 RepID=A0A1E4RMU6_9ASCO|nr:Sedlin [Hyphopichia burtonii NRRL Y-1933]ODV68590.1 Sedlin [Hyphopichia burtonii NRRL Y-1933]
MSELVEDKQVTFVALISRDDRPLYIQSFDTEINENPQDTEANTKNANKFLKYNFLSHMALDVFASPASLSLREQHQNIDDNGGVLLLFIQDDITVYGFETNNGLKIVVAAGGSADRVRSSYPKPMKLKELFSQIHKSYLKTICNPFTNLQVGSEKNESVLQSPTFDRNINKLVQSWNTF